MSKVIVIDGKEFRNFQDACKHYGVDDSYLYKKQKETGVPKDVLLKTKVQEGIRKQSFTYDDIEYKSLKEACAVYGLDAIKVQSLIDNRRITRVEALDLSRKHQGRVPRVRRGTPVQVNGEVFPSKSAVIREYKIQSTRAYELQKEGYTFEEAVNTLLREKQESGNRPKK